MSHHEPQLHRAEALLLAGAADDEVTAVEPAPPAADIGARAGLGRAWVASSVRASAYLFDSHDAASEAEARLLDTLREDRASASTLNGPLLLWATCDAADDTAEVTLDRLLDAFAGHE